MGQMMTYNKLVLRLPNKYIRREILLSPINIKMVKVKEKKLFSVKSKHSVYAVNQSMSDFGSG